MTSDRRSEKAKLVQTFGIQYVDLNFCNESTVITRLANNMVKPWPGRLDFFGLLNLFWL